MSGEVMSMSRDIRWKEKWKSGGKMSKLDKIGLKFSWGKI